jgi:hypothetical protein
VSISRGAWRSGVARQVAVAPWILADEAVLEVAKERAGLERCEGTSRSHRELVHQHLGYGAFPEHTDRYLGYCHRTTASKFRTAERAPDDSSHLAMKRGSSRPARARSRRCRLTRSAQSSSASFQRNGAENSRCVGTFLVDAISGASGLHAVARRETLAPGLVGASVSFSCGAWRS